MAVTILWSGPRSRSTAFFRSMLQRGDLLALHEPLEGLFYIGPLTIAATEFKSPESLIDWFLDGPDVTVFAKETVNRPILDIVRANERLLKEVNHGFLIRRPEEIAASWYALEGDMRIQETGIEAVDELYRSVGDAGGKCPVVIDSDDLVNRPAATMRAYCAAVGLPFLDNALQWDAGVQAEWERTQRWHIDASASTEFAPPVQADRYGLANHPEVLRFAARHRPFYERLHAKRLRIDDRI